MSRRPEQKVSTAPSETTYTLRHVYLREGDEIPKETIGWLYCVQQRDGEGLALDTWYMEPHYPEDAS